MSIQTGQLNKESLVWRESGGLKKKKGCTAQSSKFHQWLWMVTTAKYITAAFEGKCISFFGLKSGEHGNSSKYRVKNWKKKSEGMKLQNKKITDVLQSNLQSEHTFKVVLVQYTVSYLKILFPCHTNKFTCYKTCKFLVPHVLRYFATHKLLKQLTCKLFWKCYIAV